MKRLLAVLVGAGLAVGGGVAAWAQTNGGGVDHQALKNCMTQAKAANPGADRATLKDAVKQCLTAAGITPGQKHQLTPDQQARRDAVKACLQSAKAANPNASKADLRAAAKSCLDQAGISVDKIRPKVAALKACIAQARADHPGATRGDLAAAVKACVQSAQNGS